MVDKLQDYLTGLGLMERMKREKESFTQATLFGKNVDDLGPQMGPLGLGDLLRPSVHALQGIGLGFEAAGQAAKGIGGLAAIPAIQAQAHFGSEGELTDYAREMSSQGLGHMLAHPGEQISELRRSPDRLTSYAAGALEMAADPTNVLAGPISAPMKAARAAKAADRLKSVAGVSDDFALGGMAEEEAARRGEDLERIYGAAHEGGKRRVDTLRERLEAVQGTRKRREEFVNAAPDVYREVQDAGAGARKEFRESMLDVDDDDQLAFLRQYEQGAKDVARERLGPLAPEAGKDWRTYMADAKQALYDARNEENTIRGLYEAAVKQAPPPIKYDLEGNAIGVYAKLGLPNKGQINDVMNAEMAGAPVNALDDGFAGLNAAEDFAQQGTPQSVKAEVDRIGEAANIVPEEAAGFTTRMKDLISHAFREGLSEQKAAMDRKGGMISFGQFASVWKGQTTQTLRNIFMDEAFTRILASDAGIRRQYIDRSKSYLIKRLTDAEGGERGMENPLLMLGDVSDVLSQVGIGNKLSAKQRKEIVENIGINVFEAETENIQNLSAMQQLMAGVAVTLANPVRASVGLATAPLAYLAPMRQRMFHIINNVTHMAAKGEAFKQGFLPALENNANRLFALAEAEGKNVSALRGWGMEDPLKMAPDGLLLREGAFSPEKVKMVLGERYADEWQRMLDHSIQQGYKNATDVFGNYAKRGKIENGIAKFFPFMSWTWRAYPRVARMVLSHPAVMAGTLQLYQAEIEDAKANNRPGYAATTIGFNRDTPFVGALARVFSPDQEAEIRVNPLALFMPFSSEGIAVASGASDEMGDDATLYQKAEKAGAVLGLSPSPLIQAGAYVTGGDYQSPGPLSRYSQVDQMQDDLGSPLPEAPSIAHGPLRALREKITGEKDYYDPVENKVEELVFERTGKPISHPSNRRLAAEIKLGDHPLLAEAERIVDVQGAQRQIFNANSPISVQVQSETAANKRRAGKPPYEFAAIEEVKLLAPTAAKYMEMANEQWYNENPQAAVNKNAKVSDRDLTIVRGERVRKLRAQMGMV